MCIHCTVRIKKSRSCKVGNYLRLHNVNISGCLRPVSVSSSHLSNHKLYDIPMFFFKYIY